jgi:hypothetical protein
MRRFFVCVIMFVLCVVSSLRAQTTTAAVTGVITDSSKSVIPNATVTITNTDTNISHQAESNGTGNYYIPDLPAGPYRIEVEKSGFETLVKPGIVLHVQGVAEINFEMAVGSTAQSITVQSTVPSVDLTTSTISAVVDSTTVRELPLNGRDWTQLATLQPGVTAIRTQAGTGSTNNRGNRGYGNELTVAGNRPTQNNYVIDGISANDYTNAAPGSVAGVNLGVDAIREFSMVTANSTAEYGLNSGGVVNAVTKSGTNAFHGDAYLFLRDEDFDARNFFSATRTNFRRDQFGASGGGPIKKDKIFIFGDYEGLRQFTSLPFEDTVPSQDARNGIFHNADGTTTMFTVDPKVVPFLPLWPLPNAGLSSPGNIGFFLTSGPSPIHENYLFIKGDDVISTKDRLSVSYLYDPATLNTPDSLVDVLYNSATHRQLGALEETHIFSANLVNTLRLGLNHSAGRLRVPFAALNPLAVDPSLGALPGHFAPDISVPGITEMTGGLGAQGATIHGDTNGQVYDDANLTVGRQSLKFGFAFERFHDNVQKTASETGAFTFPSLLGFLTNQPTSVNLINSTISNELRQRQSLFGGYVQDDWRWRPGLTLNLGLRYEMVTLVSDARNAAWVLTDFFNGIPVPVKHFWQGNPTTKNFEPRIGFAWDPFKDGRTAVRGAFGIFDVLPLPYTNAVSFASQYPFGLQVEGSLSGQPGSFPTGAGSILPPTFDPTAPNAFAHVSVFTIEQNPHRSYVMNWNTTIQRDLGANMSVMVGYVGSRSVHQADTVDDFNAVRGQLTPAGYLWPFPVGSGTRLNPHVGPMHGTLWDGSGSYEGLGAQFKKSMSHGVQAQASYTWGRCIDNGSGGGVSDYYNNSIDSLLFYAPPSRHGNCDFDIRQVFVLNYVWTLPTPKFAGDVGEHLLGGWELGGIVSASTGTPFTPLIGGDPLGEKNSKASSYPDRLHTPGCASVVNPGNVRNYLKLNCFTPPVAPASFAAMCQPAAASVAAVISNTCMNLLGNAGRNQVFGPGLENIDFSVFKNIYISRISEAFDLQLRFEFFNILNHANFQSPLDNQKLFNQDGTSVGGAGAIDSTTTDPREIQFGLKLIW